MPTILAHQDHQAYATWCIIMPMRFSTMTHRQRSAKTKWRRRKAATCANGALLASVRRLVTTEMVFPGDRVAKEDHNHDLLHTFVAFGMGGGAHVGESVVICKRNVFQKSTRYGTDCERALARHTVPLRLALCPMEIRVPGQQRLLNFFQRRPRPNGEWPRGSRLQVDVEAFASAVSHSPMIG